VQNRGEPARLNSIQEPFRDPNRFVLFTHSHRRWFLKRSPRSGYTNILIMLRSTVAVNESERLISKNDRSQPAVIVLKAEALTVPWRR